MQSSMLLLLQLGLNCSGNPFPPQVLVEPHALQTQRAQVAGASLINEPGLAHMFSALGGEVSDMPPPPPPIAAVIYLSI